MLSPIFDKEVKKKARSFLPIGNKRKRKFYEYSLQYESDTLSYQWYGRRLNDTMWETITKPFSLN